MRRVSGVIWPAATDQREARECKEEKGKRRQALLLTTVECVYQQDIQHLHHTAMPFCCNGLDSESQ